MRERKHLEDDIRSDLAQWASRVGNHQALSRLIEVRVGTRTAERLVWGDYQKPPQGTLLTAIELAMAKDAATSKAT